MVEETILGEFKFKSNRYQKKSTCFPALFAPFFVVVPYHVLSGVFFSYVCFDLFGSFFLHAMACYLLLFALELSDEDQGTSLLRLGLFFFYPLPSMIVVFCTSFISSLFLALDHDTDVSFNSFPAIVSL